MRERRSPEPNGVARAFWEEIRGGVVVEPEDGGRLQHRKLPPHEMKLRRHAGATRRR